jgi:hypothetical protein
MTGDAERLPIAAFPEQRTVAAMRLNMIDKGCGCTTATAERVSD